MQGLAKESIPLNMDDEVSPLRNLRLRCVDSQNLYTESSTRIVNDVERVTVDNL